MKRLHELSRDELERVFNAAPFVASLGIRLIAVHPGHCETELDVEPRHLQQNGLIHAGVQATMADHTAGGAAATLLEPGRVVLTVEFKINFLRAARGQRLACRSEVLKPGSRIMVVESEVRCTDNGASTLVSKTTASIAVTEAPKTRPS